MNDLREHPVKDMRRGVGAQISHPTRLLLLYRYFPGKSIWDKLVVHPSYR